MKPRISKVRLGWLCEGQGIIGSGANPSAAYTHWLRQSYELEFRRIRAEVIKKNAFDFTAPWEPRFS